VKKHLRFRKNLSQHHLKSQWKHPLKRPRKIRQKVSITFEDGVG
jgi:hypothetical protein